MMLGLNRVERVINRPLRHAHVDLKSWCCPACCRRERQEGVCRDLIPVRNLGGYRRHWGERDERQRDEKGQNWYFFALR
jgi:hypothetical protein